MDLPEMDRFHMPEMEYSLGTEIKKIKKQTGLREDDRWGHPVILTVQRKGQKKGRAINCTRGGSNPGLPGVALLRQPLG